MAGNFFEVTKDDVLIVLHAHNTTITEKQIDEVMDDLDFQLIENSISHYTEMEDQTACMLAEIEYQMISSGMYITEPYHFSLPS